MGRTCPALARTSHEEPRLGPRRDGEMGRGHLASHFPKLSPLALELRLGRKSQGQWGMLGYISLYTENPRDLLTPQGRERTAIFIGGPLGQLIGAPPTPPSV